MDEQFNREKFVRQLAQWLQDQKRSKSRLDVLTWLGIGLLALLILFLQLSGTRILP